MAMQESTHNIQSLHHFHQKHQKALHTHTLWYPSVVLQLFFVKEAQSGNKCSWRKLCSARPFCPPTLCPHSGFCRHNLVDAMVMETLSAASHMAASDSHVVSVCFPSQQTCRTFHLCLMVGALTNAVTTLELLSLGNLLRHEQQITKKLQKHGRNNGKMTL